MAQFEVTAPNGKTYVIEGNGTKEQALEHFKANWKPEGETPTNKPVEQPVETLVEKPKSAFESFIEGLKNPVVVPNRSNLAGGALGGLVGETAKNIGAAAQLLEPSSLPSVSKLIPNLPEKIVEAGKGLVQGSEKANKVGSTVGQIGSYFLPSNAIETGVAKVAPKLAASTNLLPQMLRSSAVGGLTAGITTPGTVSERVAPTIENAVVGGAVPLVAKGVEKIGQAVKPIAEKVPSQEDLFNTASGLFEKAKESGVELKSGYFASNMAKIAKDLRAEGYTAKAYPKVASVVEELTKTTPKDFTELKALRKMIQGAQKSIDPEEKRLATILKDQFDEYIANVPDTAIKSASKELSKEGLQAWKEARDIYSKASKSEIFDEMLQKAELDKTKFTQSGAENSLAMQLRKLAENPKKMRMFTSEEQQAIKDAAKGGNVQNILRFMGKFSPQGVVPAMGGAALIASNPAVGIPFELGAMGSRYAATKIRQGDVNKLAAMMRNNGVMPEVTTNMQLSPTQQNLAKLLSLKYTTQGE